MIFITYYPDSEDSIRQYPTFFLHYFAASILVLPQAMHLKRALIGGGSLILKCKRTREEAKESIARDLSLAF
jgi:hypothetical protein